MNVTLFGGSGFVGGHLSAALRARGDQLTMGSLREPGAAAAVCAGADAVVNLAGEPVAQRWTPEAKRKIMESRVDLARALIDRLAASGEPPKAYISASAIGYYGTSESATFTEASPPGDDFLASVCTQWEAQASRAAEFGARVALVRTGIALGKEGGALAKLLPLFRFGLGGVVSSGRQWQSWVHIDDLIGIYLLAIDSASGALNATAPNPVTNAGFTRALAAAVHRPALLPAPEFGIKLLFGEGAMMLTKGQRVLPERTLALGYTFKYPAIDAALAEIAG